MCGFVGSVAPGRAVSVEAIARATRAIRHRGPDDEGYLLAALAGSPAHAFSGPDTDPGLSLPRLPTLGGDSYEIGLGFRRLSILDTSPAGHQPMATRSRSHWLVFNGEIYNHLELRPELETLGHTFETRCDTETLLAAFSSWGPGALDRLEGMWALALWSVDERSLLLARDRCGIKPLYWRQDERFSFASELRSLLELTGMERRCEAQRAFDYLRFGLTDDGDNTFFAGARQLPPAHMLQLDLGSGDLELTRYWAPPSGPSVSVDPDDAVDEVRALFLDSVEAHQLSDVPLGVALSGGIDSSSILGAVRHLKGASGEIRAFGFSSEESAIDESHWMRTAADSAGALLRTTRPSASELVRDLDRLVATQEQPFGSTSIYAQYRVYQLAREHRTPVLLSGQGADELLAGYLPYLPSRAVSLLKGGDWLEATRLLSRSCGIPGINARWLVPRLLNLILPGWLERPARRLGGEALAPGWIDSGWFDRVGAEIASKREPRTNERLRDRLLFAFAETSLPMLLRFEDRNSMAFSIESRVPFLHRPLIERLLSLPESLLIDDQARTKAVLRDGMKGLVPQQILDRKDKIGFAPPERGWLAAIDTTINEVLLGKRAHRVRGLDPIALQAEWSAVQSGRAAFDSRFWRGINLVLWADHFEVEFD